MSEQIPGMKTCLSEVILDNDGTGISTFIFRVREGHIELDIPILVPSASIDLKIQHELALRGLNRFVDQLQKGCKALTAE